MLALDVTTPHFLRQLAITNDILIQLDKLSVPCCCSNFCVNEIHTPL